MLRMVISRLISRGDSLLRQALLIAALCISFPLFAGTKGSYFSYIDQSDSTKAYFLDTHLHSSRSEDTSIMGLM